MWIDVKRQLAVDSDIVGVLWKMPHIFTNAEYADMLYVYGFCDGSATAAVEQYMNILWALCCLVGLYLHFVITL